MVRFPKITPAPKYQSAKPRVREHVGELPILRGTEKQVKYANEIRDRLFDLALFYYFSYEGEDETIKALRSSPRENRLYNATVGVRWDRPRDCVGLPDGRLLPQKLPENQVVENLPVALLDFARRHRNAEYWIENKRWRSGFLEDENDFVFDFLTFFIALYTQNEK